MIGWSIIMSFNRSSFRYAVVCTPIFFTFGGSIIALSDYKVLQGICICSESLLVFVSIFTCICLRDKTMRCICGHILPPKWIYCETLPVWPKLCQSLAYPANPQWEPQNKSVFASKEIMTIRSRPEIFEIVSLYNLKGKRVWQDENGWLLPFNWDFHLWSYWICLNFWMYPIEFRLVSVLVASYANDRMTVAGVHHSALTDSSLAGSPIILLPVAANLWIDPQTNATPNSNKCKTKFYWINSKIKQIQDKMKTNTGQKFWERFFQWQNKQPAKLMPPTDSEIKKLQLTGSQTSWRLFLKPCRPQAGWWKKSRRRILCR